MEQPSGPAGMNHAPATRRAAGLREHAFNLLWYQVRHGPEVLCSDSDPRAIDAITRSYRLGPPGYLIALLGALISPALGVVLLIGLAALNLLPSSSGA